MMFAAILVGVLGLIFGFLGWLVWKKEKITLLHDYHYQNVSEEHKKPFCTLSGIGMIVIGIGMLLTAVVLGLTDSAWSFLAFALGFAIGIAFEIYAGRKYNRKTA